jgi:hypothetical protein
MRKAIWTIVVILFFAATLCACSNDGFPTGTYTLGNRAHEFRDDGTFSYLEGDEVMTEGTYFIQDDEIQITDSYCAERDANPGTYKWIFEDGRLNFELIGEDLCEDRRSTLTLTWYGPK